MRRPRLCPAILGLLAASACARPSRPNDPSPEATARSSCDPSTAAPLPFERSPGGIPEVDPGWVDAHGCQVRLVDVREPHEPREGLGLIEGIEQVPLRQLDQRAAEWDPKLPVVLVCRSGRRSARGVALLESQGFEHVASMTGGMQRWVHEGRPVRVPPEPAAPEPAPPAAGEPAPLSQADIERHLGSPDEVRWVKTAALLLQGVESCVDGRDEHPVVGTLGGDAGELLLTLAAVEQLTQRPFTPAEVDALLGAHLDAFGRFYLHTDAHALHSLGETLARDPGWADQRQALQAPADLEALIDHPPRDRERALLDQLTRPAHVGCGHLRLVLTHPEEYGVRPALAQALLQAFFRRRWAGDPRLDYVVLEGDHHEGAVLQVVLPSDIAPYTNVPAIAPLHRDSGTTLFVAHPQLTAYLREQHAHWLAEQLDASQAPDTGALAQTQQDLAERQLQATLRHLAAGLPIYEATPQDGRWRVEPRGMVEPAPARPSAATPAATR